MTVLKGPANADHFRQKVGRYGDRFYVDPLPACSLADATDATWPSISTVKKASGQDWSYTTMKRLTQTPDGEMREIAALDPNARYERFKVIDKLEKQKAFDRGNDVHVFAEHRLYGTIGTFAHPPAGAEYYPALDAFFDAYQPELVAAEFVAIHRDLNEVGYGGTSDALVRIDGKLYIIDWKSRGGDHGAYPEEGAQLGAYAGAQYMIVEEWGAPRRRKLPALEGGLIVSIRPDGYEVYPVDLDAGFKHFEALHAWWVARRDERQTIGRKWAPKIAKNSGGASGSATDTSDGQAPGSGSTRDRPAPPSSVDRFGRPTLPTQQDEGGAMGDPYFDRLAERFKALDSDRKFWIQSVIKEADQAGVPFIANKSTGARTKRRYSIYGGLIALAAVGNDDDELVRMIVATVLESDAPFCLGFTLGHVVGCLGVDEAARFAFICDAVVAHPEEQELRERPAA